MALTYGTAAQAITITLSGLANATLRQSNFVDNTTDLFFDAIVQLNIKTAGSGVNTSLGYIDVFTYGTASFGSSYNGLTSGVDGFITSSINLRSIGRIAANSSGTVCNGIFNVAPSFGGILPDHWGIVIDNETGNRLDIDSNNTIIYQGIKF
jgi:hypothetical protein